MSENRFSCAPTCGSSRESCGSSRETVAIETSRILDSCRDRDCYENVRVYLSDYGNEILERTGAIRAKCADIMWTNIGIDPIQFNRGFYSITIRFYVKIIFEACIGGGRSQELEGIAVLEKRVILFGGDSNVNVFRSDASMSDSFCACPEPNYACRNVPSAVVEAVDPVLLGTKIMEKASDCNCCCRCCESELPEPVMTALQAPVCFDESRARRFLTVSLGIFSVVRITRPAQFLIQATEYAIPEKECVSVEEDNPCHVFRHMPFPVNDFSAQGAQPGCPMPPEKHDRDRSCRCGC